MNASHFFLLIPLPLPLHRDPLFVIRLSVNIGEKKASSFIEDGTNESCTKCGDWSTIVGDFSNSLLLETSSPVKFTFSIREMPIEKSQFNHQSDFDFQEVSEVQIHRAESKKLNISNQSNS
jgi:hypothetical protein